MSTDTRRRDSRAGSPALRRGRPNGHGRLRRELWQRLLLRERPARRLRRGSLLGRRARRAPRRSCSGQPGLRQPDSRCRSERGRGRPRPRLRRRHRRHPLGPPRRSDRHRLRPRHDRRDARARAAERPRGRRRERPLSEGPDRGDPASGRLGRRRHLQLRDQPLRRQAGRAHRDGTRPQARRAHRDHRRRRRGPAQLRRSASSAATSPAASPARLRSASTRRASRPPASRTSSVTFTHEVTDGIHGAIVKARTPTDPAAKGLPVVQPATSAGCC